MPIRMLTAYTEEIDDVGGALEELFEQIDLDDLDANSVGLVTCPYDFIETGVVRALAEKLPFDLLGMTTMASASQGELGQYRLVLTVLTSDDVRFETAHTGSLSCEDYIQRIDEVYRGARDRLTDDPTFIIAYFPYITDVGCEEIIKTLDGSADGAPIWGSFTIGSDMGYEDCRTIWNAEDDKAMLSLLLIHGAVDPEFVVTSIPERNIRENQGIITDSDGCVIKTINDLPAVDYLDSLGLAISRFDSTTIPLMLDYGDGSDRVTLGIYTINDDGGVICGADMPQNAAIALGEIDTEGILETAQQSLNRLLAAGRTKGLLMYPCVTRYIMLAPKQDVEMEAVVERVEGLLPYNLAYSGGEVCPMKGADGSYRNRFHNYTFSAVIF